MEAGLELRNATPVEFSSSEEALQIAMEAAGMLLDRVTVELKANKDKPTEEFQKELALLEKAVADPVTKFAIRLIESAEDSSSSLAQSQYC